MDLVIPDSIDSIGDYCFVNCGIKTLTLSDSVKQIGYGSFCYNSTLQQADLGNGIEKIGRSAFYGCNNLADIQIGDQVRYMGADALEETAFYAESTNWENNKL